MASDTNHLRGGGPSLYPTPRSGSGTVSETNGRCDGPKHLLHGDVSHDDAAHLHRRGRKWTGATTQRCGSDKDAWSQLVCCRRSVGSDDAVYAASRGPAESGAGNGHSGDGVGWSRYGSIEQHQSYVVGAGRKDVTVSFEIMGACMTRGIFLSGYPGRTCTFSRRQPTTTRYSHFFRELCCGCPPPD